MFRNIVCRLNLGIILCKEFPKVYHLFSDDKLRIFESVGTEELKIIEDKT